MNSIIAIAQNTIKALIRKKDFYVFFILLLLLLSFFISQSFFGMNSISRYIKDIGFYCVWLFTLAIAVTFSAKQIPDEIKSKTILTLLSKPVSKIQLLLGRFFGSFITVSFAFSILFILFISFSFIKGEGISYILLLQSYILGICFVSMICAVSILFSLYFTFGAACFLSFILYFAIMWFGDILRVLAISPQGIFSFLSTILYYIIPHFEFYDLRVRLVHSWGPLPLFIILSIITYTIFYISILLLTSYYKLKNKSL